MAITLSGGIPTWFVDQFANTLYHVCQQKESLFEKAVRVESVLGAEDKAFDSIGKIELEEKTGRNVQTPTVDPSTQRRWVNTTPFHQAVLKDIDDDLSMALDPQSDFIQSLNFARNRKVNSIILAAIDGPVTSGRRAGSTITWAGSLGNTAYDLNSDGTVAGRTIIHDCTVGNCSSTDVGLTIEKLELVKEYFAANEVDEMTPIWGAISPRQATNLFGQMEYTSSDYNNEKPLASGRIIRNYHGINFIVTNNIVKGVNNDIGGDTNVFRCPFWAQDGIILGVQDSVSISIDKRADLSLSAQIYIHMNMGAMRMDEDKVCYVECQ